MSRIKTHVHKGDSVAVVAGKHKGASGKILQVFPAKSQVIVEGVRMITKHEKKTQTSEGGRIQIEGPIHISNVRAAKEAPAKPARKTAARKAAKK